MKNNIEEQLELPCGSMLSNRLCKTAMTEGLSDELNNLLMNFALFMKMEQEWRELITKEMYKSIEDIWREQET